MGSLHAIAEVINMSAECNHVRKVSRKDGSTIVHTYDWTILFTPTVSLSLKFTIECEVLASVLRVIYEYACVTCMYGLRDT